MPPGDDTPHISVAVGIIVGLVASFIQSLGLTIQRKSHLANEAQTPDERKRDWQRPLWLAGFSTFILANVFGTVFQIGALPIIVLGPLGAVSLLWNAFFARFILGDEFSIHLAAGIALIAGGACLIAIFGAVPEPTHTLDELVRLYRRPAFLAWISVLAFVLSVAVAAAHVTEWTLERKIARVCPSATPLTPRRSSWRKRRWSAPSRPSSVSVGPPQSSIVKSYGAVDERRPSGTVRNDGAKGPLSNGRHVTIGSDGHHERQEMSRAQLEQSTQANRQATRPTRIEIPHVKSGEPEQDCAITEEAIAKSRLLLGVVYGSASGTLSGLCLLFTKTSVELLILTFAGRNQFNRVEAWLIVGVLVVAELTQLWYLNRALRLIGPTLCCPLAFMAYALTSMISGLIYYDQWDELAAWQFVLVALGTILLLSGVWTVSLKTEAEMAPSMSDEASESALADSDHEHGHGAVIAEPDSYLSDSEEEPAEWIPKGLSIGIAASSPGFDLRPTARHRHRRTTSTASRSDQRNARSSFFSSASERDQLVHSPTIDHDGEGGGLRRPAIRQGTSLSGALYVGRRDSVKDGDGSTNLDESDSLARSASFVDLEFSYPLKLIVPDRKFVPDRAVEAVYVLSYGGGLVAGDECNLNVKVEGASTLVMLTQGSTKVFKARPGRYLSTPRPRQQPSSPPKLVSSHPSSSTSPLMSLPTRQTLHATISSNSTLCLLPCPVTCFKQSNYSQKQTFELQDETSSLIVLDWYTSGRAMTDLKSLGAKTSDQHVSVGMAEQDKETNLNNGGGENWSFKRYRSHNEVRSSLNVERPLAKDVLLLIDDDDDDDDDDTNLKVDLPRSRTTYSTRVNPYSCYASLIMFGPVFTKIVSSLSSEFDKVTQYKQNLPFSLLWSFSPLQHSFERGHNTVDDDDDGKTKDVVVVRGGIVRCCGATTEQVKDWIVDMLTRGGIDDVIGKDLWKVALT
ncbi:hypothetical protein ACM66B_001008 [Microbotryomycetes sp. NB124-2]